MCSSDLVETVGTVSTRHQEISQGLTELTVLYEQSLHSNQQLEKTLQQFQQLYQESVTQNQNLLGSLKTLTDGLLLKEELNASQSQNFQNSIVELKNILHKPWADLAASYQNLDKKLHGQSNQSPNFELKILQKFDSLRKQVENLKDQSIAPASKSLQTLQESLQLFQEIRHEMVATLSNYKVAVCSLGCVSLILMGFCLAAQASSVSATSMRSSISAFGGQNYHAVALSIMDSNYRQENLNRIDRCREKNQKIKSDISRSSEQILTANQNIFSRIFSNKP